MQNIRQCEKTKEEVTTISGSMDGLYEAQGVLINSNHLKQKKKLQF